MEADSNEHVTIDDASVGATVTRMDGSVLDFGKPSVWHTTSEEQPGGSAAEHGLVLAMYVNGLTAIPAIVAPEIVRMMPAKYPKWRYLIEGQDFVEVAIEPKAETPTS